MSKITLPILSEPLEDITLYEDAQCRVRIMLATEQSAWHWAVFRGDCRKFSSACGYKTRFGFKTILECLSHYVEFARLTGKAPLPDSVVVEFNSGQKPSFLERLEPGREGEI